MSILRKKGFTLIELMVVIVIIGILAAIAIPKLFGMSAKAKASEVGPAAGTWSKLQTAYLIETTTLGDAIAVGYTPPGGNSSTNIATSGNFGYSISGARDGGNAATFSATNLEKLNACTKGEPWEVSGTISNSEDQAITYTFKVGNSGTVAAGALASGDCGSLTPNFAKLQ